MVKSAESTISDEDLKFLASVCMLSLKDLGYIPSDSWKAWAIEFSDHCEEQRAHGATLQTSRGQGILLNRNTTRANVLEIIAHEAVHLVQFMRGDVRNIDSPG